MDSSQVKEWRYLAEQRHFLQSGLALCSLYASNHGGQLAAHDRLIHQRLPEDNPLGSVSSSDIFWRSAGIDSPEAIPHHIALRAHA